MIIDKNISLFFLKIARCSRSESVFTFLLSTSPCSCGNSIIFLFGMVLPFLLRARVTSSSETQGQIVGARESLSGLKNMTRRKVKNGEKSSSRRSLFFFLPYFSARLDFPSPPLSAPGSPRMG